MSMLKIRIIFPDSVFMNPFAVCRVRDVKLMGLQERRLSTPTPVLDEAMGKCIDED
jgi:hypothetical protein